MFGRQQNHSSAPLETRDGREQGGDGCHDPPLLTRAFEWPDERPPRFAPRLSPGAEPLLTPSVDPPSGPSSVGSYQERTPGSHPEGSSSRVVLPPVRDLLEELGMLSPEQYERAPVLPQLRLPEERGVREEEERGRKKGRVEMGEEGEEKRPVARKIYIACDFCRGRKLRCDGGRPQCFNCKTRSLECKYQEHPRRRGPGKAPKGTRARKPRKKGGGEDPDAAGPSGTV